VIICLDQFLFLSKEDIEIKKYVIDLIQKYNTKIIIKCIAIPEVTDIWIRDWAPIPSMDESGKTVAVKSLYWSRYPVSSKTYREKAKRDDTAL